MNGKCFVRSTKSSHKPTAQKVAEGLFRSLQIESVKGPSNDISLSDAIERYISVRKGSANERMLHSKHRTVLKYIDRDKLLSEMTGADLTQFITARRSEGKAAQTIKHGVQFICAVMKQARREGFDVSPVETPVVPVKSKRLRYLSQDEEDRLLKELDPFRTGPSIPEYKDRPSHILKELHDNYDLVILLLDTGARYSEIAKIKWDQIDLEDRSIRLWRPKVSNESIIYMTSRVFDVLSKRNETRNNQYVFTNRSGGHRGPTCTGIRKAYKRAGLLDCTIHTLRHTHASRLFQNGLSIYEVRSVLGHTDITTTMRYAHLENVDVTQRARDVIEKLNATSL